MSTFVLVPGAWLGAWVWQTVVGGLRALGHEVHAVSLAGLAERAGDDPDKIGLTTHVRDVLALLEGEDLREVVLVGHSYAGLVAGQAADWARDRVRHTVFLDANLPRDGQAMTDAWSERGRQIVLEAVAEHEGRWPPPEIEDFDGHDLDAEQVMWLLGHATSHPGHTLFEPAVLTRPLSELSATYVTSLRPPSPPRDEVLALRSSPGWRFAELDTGHWPMVSRPQEVVTLLHSVR